MKQADVALDNERLWLENPVTQRGEGGAKAADIAPVTIRKC